MAVNSVQNLRVEKTKKKSVKTGCILILLAFCFVLLVFSACLLTVLVLIGKSIVAESNNTNSKLPINRVSTIVNFVNTFMNYSPNQTNQFNRTFFRLPNKNIKPVAYNLYLNPNLETGNFSGNLKINLSIGEDTTTIYFHGKHLNIFDPELSKTDSINNTLDNIRIKSLVENVNSEMWIVTTETNLTPGNYELVLNFTGTMSNKIVGFYKSDYYNSQLNETRTIATSKFEPTYARQAFPCFDEPGMKAVYDVKLAVPKNDNYFALSNMNELENNDDGDTRIYHFSESVKMSTYLTCFIVSDFAKNGGIFNSAGKDVPFTVYSSPDNIDKTHFAKDVGISIIEFYTEYFNISYPLPKLDLAAIPDFSSGAMETWGLVTFREARVLYEETISSIQDKQGIALVVAHELAHMWFGNLVTMKWWNDLWLNEGFATFIEYIGVDKKYPKWQMLDQFLISELHTAFRADSKLTSHPIVQTVDTPDQITAIFDTISYSKGSSVLRMLQGFMDLNEDESFQRGITNYLNNHKFENTETQDLWNALGELYEPMNITQVMSTWTEQMGFPIVNVVRNKNQYILTQERFLIDSDYDQSAVLPSKYNYKWTIPVTYVICKAGTCDKTKTLQWFRYTDTELKVDVPLTDGDIVKFNSEQIGYYRVNYDDETWAHFSKNMKVFSVSDQASLLDDAFNLAKAQKLKYSIALDLSTYLKDSMDYVPWSVAATNFKDLDTYLAGSQSYVKYRAYIKGLVDKAYNALGWSVEADKESAEDDQHLKRLLRSRILKLACSFGHSECLKVAGQQFQSWLDKTNSPHPDIRNIVYYYGMSATGTEDSWNKMWERYLKEEDAQEKKNFISGLSAIREPWLLSRFIDLAWDTNNVRRQDYFSCLSAISANPVGTSLVWDYVRLNWEKLVDEFGLNDRYLGRLIPDITGSFTTEIRELEMKQFFAKYPDAGAGESARKQALETVANNIKWLEKNKNSVDEWLETAVPKKVS